MPKEDSSSSWHLYFSSRSLIASSRRSFCRLSNWAARILISLIKSASRVVLYILRLLILYYTSIEISVTIRITLEKNRRLLPTARGEFRGETRLESAIAVWNILVQLSFLKVSGRWLLAPGLWQLVSCHWLLVSGSASGKRPAASSKKPRIKPYSVNCLRDATLDISCSFRSVNLFLGKVIPCTHNSGERDPDIITR